MEAGIKSIHNIFCAADVGVLVFFRKFDEPDVPPADANLQVLIFFRRLLRWK